MEETADNADKVCNIICCSEVPLYHLEVTALCLRGVCISILSSFAIWLYGGINGQPFVIEEQIFGYTSYTKPSFSGTPLLHANAIVSQELSSNISY